MTELWTRPPGQIPALDALRATAVLLVVCSHYVEGIGTRVIPVVSQSRFHSLPFFHFGWSGVDLFFILSGLLIGRQLWKERLTTGTVRFRNFFLRRGFRIWPLYYVTLAFYKLFGILHPRWSDVAFVSNYFPSGFDRGWSLSTEEQFYILVPLLLLATRAVKRPSRYAWGLGGALLLVLSFRWMTLVSLTARGVTGHELADAMYFAFHLHCESLIAGLAIAYASVVRPQWFSAEGSPRRNRILFGLFVGASALGLALRTFNNRLFGFTALALIFGSLTVWLMLDRGIANRIASARIFYPISRLSYGMYLNHFFVLPSVTVWVVTTLRDGGASEPVWFFTGLLAGTLTSMVVAAVTFYAVELPFLRIRDRVLAPHGHAHAPVSHGTSAAAGAAALAGTDVH
ncbi:MAG: acyltransferase [Gemmatimonadaceae bacterium]